MRSARRLLAAALASAAWAAGAAHAGESVDPAAKLPLGDSASEYWDLVAILEDGVRVTARFTIANEGPGGPSAAASGHVLRPGAAPVPFQNGRRSGDWRLTEDRRRVEIGSSLLVLEESERHFEVDNDKRGIKVFLDWRADETARVAKTGPGGYRIDVIQLASPVQASLWVSGMAAPLRAAGTLALAHTWMPEAESTMVLRRIDVASVEAGSGMYLLDILAPDAVRYSWLSVSGHGPGRVERHDLVIRSEPGPGGDYPVPKRLSVSAPGLEGHVSLGEPSILQVDPLSALPAFLRMLYSLRGRPHRSWTSAHFDLSLASAPDLPAIRVAGDAIAAVTFLDTLPPSEMLP